MVDVVWCNDEDIKNEQRRVLFLDIITDAAGLMGDCVHKGTRGVHKGSMGNIQSQLPRKAVRSLLACLYWVFLGDYVEHYPAKGD